MKKSLHIILSVVLCLSLMLPGFATTVQAVDAVSDKNVSSTATIDQNFADNRVLVVLTREASMTFTTYTANSFASLGCVSVTDLSDATGAMVKAAMEQAMETFSSRGISDLPSTPVEHSETISNYRQVLCLELNEASKENVIETIKLLSERDDVLYAGPDYIVTIEICNNENENELARATSSDEISTNEKLWAIEKIDLPSAWDYTTGSSNVIVGVLDTGINATHPAISENINNSLCRDFTTGQVVADPNPTDPRNHGTAVASIIGAKHDNLGGLYGVCNNVSMVSLKVIKTVNNVETTMQMSWFITAINYATGIGVHILNFSAGWYEEDPAYDYAVAAAVYNYPGLFVCAAGNSGENNNIINNLPANYDFSNLIAVGSSTQSDEKDAQSCYGSASVELFAPGTDVYAASGINGYALRTGTSYAAPYVSGVAALMLAVNSDLTPSQLKNFIMTTVDPITALSTLCISGGRLNADGAVIRALITP